MRYLFVLFLFLTGCSDVIQKVPVPSAWLLQNADKYCEKDEGKTQYVEVTHITDFPDKYHFVGTLITICTPRGHQTRIYKDEFIWGNTKDFKP